jgi:GTP-binding protein Era
MSGFRSGFVALVGRPNVGKSTLLNALIGQQLSIVTPRPQTTRDRVVGISNFPDGQIAFVDTPGLHEGARRALNRAMNRTAGSALADADLVVMVIDAQKWTEEDELVIQRIQEAKRPAFAALNKIDRLRDRARLLPQLERLAGYNLFSEIVPISALRADNLATLQRLILAALPEAPAMFPPDQLTDRSERFRIGEIIREQLTLELHDEVPYGIAIEIESFEHTPGTHPASASGNVSAAAPAAAAAASAAGPAHRRRDRGSQHPPPPVAGSGRTEVGAVIWVDREGQKPIVIGAGGERLKRVGRAARLKMNQQFGGRFHLTLWVKVREDWADDARALAQLGVT